MSKSTSDSLNRKTTESLIWFTALPLLTHGLRVISSIFLARILSPNDFGIMGILTVIIYYSNNISTFGLANAIIQKKDLTKSHIDAYFCFNLLISSLLTCLFFNLSENIASYFNSAELNHAVKAYSVIFLITALIAIPQTHLRKELDFKSLAIIESFKTLLSITISIALALNGFGFWSMIIAMITANLVSAIYLIFITKIKPRLSFQLKKLRQLFNFGIWDFLWGQSKVIGDDVDKIIIGKILGTELLGIYDKAFSFSKMPNDQIGARISMISFSTFSKLKDNKEELSNYLQKIFISCTFLSTPIYIGLLSIAEPFTKVLLGEQWTPMIPTFQIFTLCFLIISLNGPLSAFNMATGQIKQQTLGRFAALLLLIISLLYAAENGILAASYCILVFNLAIFSLSYRLANTKISLPLFKLLLLLAPSLIGSALVYLCVSFSQLQFAHLHPLLNLIISVFLGITTYIFWFWLAPFKSWNFLRNKIKITVLKLLPHSSLNH